jgi:hypothetical protein
VGARGLGGQDSPILFFFGDVWNGGVSVLKLLISPKNNYFGFFIRFTKKKLFWRERAPAT